MTLSLKKIKKSKLPAVIIDGKAKGFESVFSDDEKDMEALKLLNAESTNPERRIPVGTRLYRSRILSDKHKAGKESGFFGYGKDDSFVPPANVTRDMRANYRYIPYFYCANPPYTALVEVRPRLGADVSIATIVTKEELR